LLFNNMPPKFEFEIPQLGLILMAFLVKISASL